MNITTRWRAVIAIGVALSMAFTITVSTAPDSAAQEDAPVTGVLRAGESPLPGVTISNSLTTAVTDANGQFTMSALPGLDDVLLESVQTPTHPEFALTGGIDFDQSPLVVELPEVVDVEFTIEGGFYRDCTIEEALEGTCPTDEFFCTIDDALAGICDEVFIEIRSEVNTSQLVGPWSSVGESQDNSLTIPVFNEPGVMIYAFTVDAGIEEFAWNGTSSQTLDMGGPQLQDWYPDIDIDGYGDEFAEPISAGFPPGPEYVLDNNDCDDGDTLINPAAEDIPGNGIDEDCDGLDAVAVAQLELRFDVVRENGEVCPNDFDSATDGPGEPLTIDESEEVTYCFWLFNNSDIAMTDVAVESLDVGIDLTSLPDIAAGATLLFARDGFAPPGVFEILAYADAIAGEDVVSDFDTAIVDVLPPPLPELELRFDVVRENGEVCPNDFESATPGPGEPLAIDQFEEVTYCFWLFNNSDSAMTDVAVESLDVGIDLTSLPDLLPGEMLLLASDGFVPVGVSDILAFAFATAGGTPVSGFDDAIVDVLPPPLPPLELRFDVVRENGEVCPANFESATEGPGEPLLIDEFEELTFCFAVINNSETTITDVMVGSDDFGIGQFELGSLAPGAETVFGTDGFVDPGFVEINGWATAVAAGTLLQANDAALVDSIILPTPIFLWIDNYEITDPDQIIEVAVTLDPGFEIPVGAAAFSVLYDPAVITPVLGEDPVVATPGAPLCTGLGVACGPINPDGLIRVAVVRPFAISGDVVDIVGIPFRAVGDGETQLSIVDVQVFDENADFIEDVITADGSVLVQLPLPGPTCAGLPVTIDMRTGASGIGTPFDDVIMGTSGADIIQGRGGNDVICALGGDDEVKAGAGNDVVHGGGGNDVIKGGSGDDELRGGAGLDVIRGNSGLDEVYGGADDDQLWGDSDNDQVRGGPGNDQMRGGSGEDDLRGGAGMDTIWGGRDADRLYGNLDDDILRGGSGDDFHAGGSGFDVCKDRVGSNSFSSCETDRPSAGPA